MVGKLAGLTPEVQGAVVRLRLAAGDDAELALRPPWHRLVGDLERHGLATADAARPVGLAAYHLESDPSAAGRWVAGPGSLVVLEPEWLEDVTSLTRTQYCERHYLIDKFRPDPANEATLRGNLTHSTFRQIVASPDNNALLREALDRALAASVVQLAALGVEPEAAREAALPGLRQLVRWARTRAPGGEPRSETFLLAHRLGMRGRIDAAWEGQDGQIVQVAELKAGPSMRDGAARVEHQLQVGAYGLMLAERGEADLRQERLLLLYAGNPPRNGQPDLERQVPFRLQTFANLVHFRNRLVLIDLTGRAVYAQPSRCRPCSRKHTCHNLTELLEEPRCGTGCVLEGTCSGGRIYAESDREFFRRWVALLDEEWRAINDATARLWRTPPALRCADGTAARVTAATPGPGQPDRSRPYTLLLENDCEIRRGDRVLLSDEDGPAAGRVAQVEVVEVGDRRVDVLASETLRFSPCWLDQYGSDRLFLRNYEGLYAWLAEPPPRRALVTLLRPPRFSPAGPEPRLDLPGGRTLNEQQRAALALALRAEDYLVIQGPPGTGKTEVIAALARQIADGGERVLLLAGTNRALDRLLSACARLGLEDRLVRLGSRPEPASAGERRLLATLAAAAGSGEVAAGPAGRLGSVETACRAARELLFGSPIVAATVATLGAGDYAALRGRFDTVVLDEASQVTLPAALLALGFGRRFVLVGDHRQLPPVVQSAAAPSQDGPGLAESLFERLANARGADGEPGLVVLEEQYRMNAEICGFPSQAWYDGRLRPAPAVAASRLAISPPDTAGMAEGPGSDLQALLDPARPVVFVDLPGSTVNAPRTNRREAELTRLLLEAALEGGVPPTEMAAIAPFRAQVALIRLELARSGQAVLRERASELCDTVDRFQGSERALLVYSFATFSEDLHPLLLDQRRLNVALTRARHKLILLGDLRVLRREPRFADLERYCSALYPDGRGVIAWTS